MARHLRVEYAGAIYHATCRMLGESRGEISRLFRDDRDRGRFLKQLAERVEWYGIRLYLFVLMTNHFHLVFETPSANCSAFMQSLCTAYTVYFNLRHGRHGHLLDGRFKAKLVQGDDYLLALSRYVHLNPVKVAGIRDKPIEERVHCLRAYRWSSLASYCRGHNALPFVTGAPLLSEMGGKRWQQRRQYRQFVESGLAKDDADFKAAMQASPRCIGGEAFRGWVDELYRNMVEKRRRPEDASLRRVLAPLAAETVLAEAARALGVEAGEFKRRRRNSALRGVAARLLVKYSGLTQREVAALLGVGTGAAVSTQIRKVQAWTSDDARLRSRILRAEAALQALRTKSLNGHSAVKAYFKG